MGSMQQELGDTVERERERERGERRGSSELLPSRVLELSVSQDPDSFVQCGRLSATVSAVWLSQTRFPPGGCRRVVV